MPQARGILPGMHRLLPLLLLGILAACSDEPRNFEEATIVELHDQMQRGELRAEELTAWYLERIETIDAAGVGLNAIIEVNPDAIAIARSLDEEWRLSGPRGPLHGIPVVLKANIDTADRMHTHAGSLALASHQPPRDAGRPATRTTRLAIPVDLPAAQRSPWPQTWRASRSALKPTARSSARRA